MSEVSLDERCPIKVGRKLNVKGTVAEEEMMETNEGDDDDEEDDDDELPWCVLCNGDATVRCLDCGRDLYCNRCSKEVHEDDERWLTNADDGRPHRIVQYKGNKKAT